MYLKPQFYREKREAKSKTTQFRSNLCLLNIYQLTNQSNPIESFFEKRLQENKMNKEKNPNGKYLTQHRGRWSMRLNNELLDLVQKEVDNWDFISNKLGFSVDVRCVVRMLFHL